MRSSVIILLVAAAAHLAGAQQTGMPGEEYNTFSSDGSWTWYGDPKAVYHEGSRRTTYVGWITLGGNAVIGAYDHGTRKITTSTVHYNLGSDDHNHPSVHVRSDGRILTMYSRHSGPEMYYRISRNPEDITSWGAEGTLPENVDGGRGFCYPNIQELSDEGTIYCFFRGGNYRPCFSTSKDGGQTWSAVKRLMLADDYAHQRPYLKFCGNGKDEIHIAFEAGLRHKKHNWYYGCYRKGGFYTADGTKFADMNSLPFDVDKGELMYDAAKEDREATCWDIALDEKGNPAVAWIKFDTHYDHIYHYTRWSGSRWIRTRLFDAGGPVGGEWGYSGGLALDHENPDIMYVSRSRDGVFEIERGVTSDLGQTWQWTALTKGSANINFRPCVPRGYTAGDVALIWLNARSYSGYKDVRATIKYYNGGGTTDITVPRPPDAPAMLRFPDEATFSLNGARIGRRGRNVAPGLAVRSGSSTILVHTDN